MLSTQRVVVQHFTRGTGEIVRGGVRARLGEGGRRAGTRTEEVTEEDTRTEIKRGHKEEDTTKENDLVVEEAVAEEDKPMEMLEIEISKH